jgi:hypothetical protein
MQSFTVLIASRGTTNKRDHSDEVREGYSGASTTHLELVFLQADPSRRFQAVFRIRIDPDTPSDGCGRAWMRDCARSKRSFIG